MWDSGSKSHMWFSVPLCAFKDILCNAVVFPEYFFDVLDNYIDSSEVHTNIKFDKS